MLLVVKLGGSILKAGTSEKLIEDIKKILESNQIVFVHGGGAEVTEIASKLGKEQQFIIDDLKSRIEKETLRYA